jgi:hypothetical protein
MGQREGGFREIAAVVLPFHLPPHLRDMAFRSPRHGHYPAGMSPNPALVWTKEPPSVATQLPVALDPVMAYWPARYAHRSAVAPARSRVQRTGLIEA